MKDKETEDMLNSEEWMSFPVDPILFLGWLSNEISERVGINDSLDLIEFIQFTTGTFLLNYEMMQGTDEVKP